MNRIMVIIVLLVKKPIESDYSAMTEEVETNPKTSKLKMAIGLELQKA